MCARVLEAFVFCWLRGGSGLQSFGISRCRGFGFRVSGFLKTFGTPGK